MNLLDGSSLRVKGQTLKKERKEAFKDEEKFKAVRSEQIFEAKCSLIQRLGSRLMIEHIKHGGD
jgi:hypothetical protein